MFDEPAPVRHRLQNHPHARAERAGQVGKGRVAGDHHIEPHDDRRGFCRELFGPHVMRIGQLHELAAESHLGELRGARALLQRHETHVPDARQRCCRGERKRARLEGSHLLRLGIAAPVEPDLQARQSGQPLAPPAYCGRVDAQVGNTAGNAVELGAHGKRDAQQRDVQVELRQRLAAADEPAAHAEGAQQQRQDRLRLEHHVRAQRLEHRDIAAELQRVPESLIGVHEQRPAGKRLGAGPTRSGQRALQLPRMRQLRARLVQWPPFAELPEGEVQQCLHPGGGRIFRPDRERAVEIVERLPVTPEAAPGDAGIEKSIRVVGLKHNSAGKVRQRLGGTEQPHQHRATVADRFRRVWVENHSRREAREGFVVALEQRECDATLKVHIKLLRRQLRRPVEARERLGRPAELQTHLSPPQVSRSSLRCQRERALEAREGLGVPPEARQREPAVVVRGGSGTRTADRPVETLDRLGRPAQGEQLGTAVGVQCRMKRLQSERALDVHQRLRVPTRRGFDEAEVMVCVDIGRIERDRSAEALPRFVRATETLECHAQGVERLMVAGCQPQRLAETRLSGFGLTQGQERGAAAAVCPRQIGLQGERAVVAR